MTAEDPFASQPKVPSISWKGSEVGTFLTLELDKPAETVTYGKWPDGNDKKNAVATGTVKKFSLDPSIVGETRSLWALIPGSLFIAIRDAQRDAGGQRLAPGGLLHVKVTGETPTGKGNPRRDFAAKYEPPAEPITDDEIPF